METLAPEISDYELERGKPMPSLNHSAVQSNLIFELKTRYREQFRFLSEINVAIAGRVMVPDIGIFPTMVLDMANDSIVARQLPLTTIEILSPDDRMSEVREKLLEYLEWGVLHVWLIDPRQRVFSVFDRDGLRDAPHFNVPEANCTLTPAGHTTSGGAAPRGRSMSQNQRSCR